VRQLAPSTVFADDVFGEHMEISVVLVCLFCQLPTIGELSDGLERQIEARQKLKFEYDVIAKFEKTEVSPELDVRSQDTFRILRADDRDGARRCWVRRVDRGEGWRVSKFISFDGTASAVYESAAERLRPSGAMGSGAIVAFEQPFHYEHNLFDDFLNTNLAGSTDYADPRWELSHQSPIKWEVKSSYGMDGRTVYVLLGEYAQFKLLYDAHMLGSPDYLLIRRDVRWIDASKPTLSSLHVTAIGTVDSIAYPAAGRFFQPGYGEVKGKEYEFKVLTAEIIDESTVSDWLPEWPPGTIVKDQINNTAFTIPFSAEQLSKMDLDQFNDQVPRRSISRVWMVLANLLLFLMILVVLFYRHVRSNGKSGNI
jgi:hypothetical protein